MTSALFTPGTYKETLRNKTNTSTSDTNRSNSPWELHAEYGASVFDSIVNDFFESHPYGEGIEVACGVSRRFHRLSAYSDWPQFSWKAINTPEWVSRAQMVFPTIDNYKNISDHQPLRHWPFLIDWRNNKPKVIIFNEANIFSSIEDIIDQCRRLSSAHHGTTVPITLLLCHTVKKLAHAFSELNMPMQVRTISIKRKSTYFLKDFFRPTIFYTELTL